MDEKILTEKLEAMRQQYHVAGMAVSVTDREKIIYKKGFGMESAERPEISNTPQTMFRIASVTKVVAGIMLMRLVEEGVMELDRLIADYMPELVLKRPEALKQLTLRHLLTHTGGFPTDGVLPEGSRDEWDVADDIARIFPTLEIANLPEEGVFAYANMGFTLAVHIAGKLTGKSMTQLFDDYVLSPLGMDRTTLDFYRAATWPFSQAHEPDGNGGWTVTHYQRINTLYNGGGGIYSNVEDLSKLARFLLNRGVNDRGQRLLTEDSLNKMFAKHSVYASEPGDFYGMAIHIHTHGDRSFYGHCGNYHPYHTSVFVDPKTGLGVCLLMNTAAEPMQCGVPDLVIDLIDDKEE